MNLNNIGIVVKDPTRCMQILLPEELKVEPHNPTKFERIISTISSIWDSDFMFNVKIVFLRSLEITAFVLAYYFMNGGSL